MPVTAAEIKKALIAAGFELYRTRGDEVQVADRVRENLIMDSGVSIRASDAISVKVILRAQRSDFPSDVTQRLFDRARELAGAIVARGYCESAAVTSTLSDPTDPSRTLDTWYEVTFEKKVTTLEEAMAEVGIALKIEKTARFAAPTSV